MSRNWIGSGLRLGSNIMTYSARAEVAKLTNDIINSLNDYVLKAKTPNALAARMLERDILNVKKIDICDFYDLKGMLAAVMENISESRANHESAISASGGNPFYKHHYAISLNQFYEYTESSAVLEELVRRDGSDLEFLDSLIAALTHSGRFHRAAQWMDKRDRLCPENPHEDAEHVRGAVLPFMQEKGLDDLDVHSAFARAFNIVRGANVRVSDVSLMLPEKDGNAALAMLVHLIEPIEVIADLIEVYSENEAQHGDINTANKVMASFVPAAA